MLGNAVGLHLLDLDLKLQYSTEKDKTILQRKRCNSCRFSKRSCRKFRFSNYCSKDADAVKEVAFEKTGL